MKTIHVGIYGDNGHQIHDKLKRISGAKLTAICVPDGLAKRLTRQDPQLKVYPSLSDMLADDGIDLISLCSPVRRQQEADAIASLNAKKHVYAEKPAAFTEAGLDRILTAAKENGVEFHEMADTVFYEPYWSMRKLIREGMIGKVVQVYAQKSYPSRFDSRPQDEETDGGLIRWVGIHAVRFIEHITGIPVKKVFAYETHLGNTAAPEGGLFTAASLAMSLENGGVASVCLNYLNPQSFDGWGNECVRVFGDRGMMEATDGGKRTHLYTANVSGEIDCQDSDCEDYLQLLIRHLQTGAPMPMTIEEELHPLRVVIRAKEQAIQV